MAIHFDFDRLEAVKNAHDQWWRGELDRPLVKMIIPDAHKTEKRTPAPLLSQQTCADLKWTPEQVIDAMDEEMSQYEFLGDAFPMVNFIFYGPGVLAAFCGARLDNSSGNVWFFPDKEREIGDIHIRYDPENPWAQRVKALYKAGWERWQGLVTMGMPDLGGVLDVVATFRGSQNLLMDLYDEPDEVKRLIREAQDAWYAAYADCRAAMGDKMLYSDWSGILSSKPSYILQCDFCYMIGNPMFREFVLDTLKEDVARLDNTIYHLDGIGELNHMEDILALKQLNAVQWVFGDGQPDAPHWIDVYRRIQAAGKQMWINSGLEGYLEVLSQLHGTPYFNASCSIREIERAYAVLNAR